MLSLTLAPRYSVSCKLVEYSWRFPLRNLFQENNEGNLSLDLSVLRIAENGRRNRRVRRYVVTRIANTATTMIAIFMPCQYSGHIEGACSVRSRRRRETYNNEVLAFF